MTGCLDMNALAAVSGTAQAHYQVGDYFVQSITGGPLLVQNVEEQDEAGNTIANPIAISTRIAFYVACRFLYRAFAIDFLVYQRTQLHCEIYDVSSYYRSSIDAPYEPPEGVRRYSSAYYGPGIGFVGIFGPPSGIEEGSVLAFCPLGPAIGVNPVFPREGIPLTATGRR